MGAGRDRKLVVVHLSGGNDYLNCVVPYNDPRYVDGRPNVRITEDRVLPLDTGYGLNPGMQPIKDLYEEGKVAIVHGVGYPEPNRSHFRSMDIWHTAEAHQGGGRGLAWQRRETDAARRREPGRGRQLRRRAPAGSRVQGCAGRLGHRSRLLRSADPHRRRRRAQRGPGRVQEHIRPGHRKRTGNGLPQPDRTRRAQGRRCPQLCARTVLFERGVCRELFCPGP